MTSPAATARPLRVASRARVGAVVALVGALALTTLACGTGTRAEAGGRGADATVAAGPGGSGDRGAELTAADPARPALVVDPDVERPDAAIVWDPASASYRMFTTNQWYAHVPTWQSPSPGGPWTYVGDALPTVPSWAVDDGRHVWAPDVALVDGTWTMWAAAIDPTGTMCVFRATADGPDGPYRSGASTPEVCPRDQAGAIDPQLVRDTSGGWTLLVKADGNEIGRPSRVLATRLDAEGRPTGDLVTLLSSDLDWEHGLVESPGLIVDPGHDRWWLTFSGGSASTTDSTYRIAAVSCDGPLGPCDDDPITLVASNEQGQGPGEQGAFVDRDGQSWLAYGPWGPFFTDHPRPLALVKVGFAADGRPFVATP